MQNYSCRERGNNGKINEWQSRLSLLHHGVMDCVSIVVAVQDEGAGSATSISMERVYKPVHQLIRS